MGSAVAQRLAVGADAGVGVAIRVKDKPRNRKAQDATLININALKRQIEQLEERVHILEGLVEAASRGTKNRTRRT